MSSQDVLTVHCPMCAFKFMLFLETPHDGLSEEIVEKIDKEQPKPKTKRRKREITNSSKMIAYLSSKIEPRSANEIAIATGIPLKSVSSQLIQLVRSGKLNREQVEGMWLYTVPR